MRTKILLAALAVTVAVWSGNDGVLHIPSRRVRAAAETTTTLVEFNRHQYYGTHLHRSFITEGLIFLVLTNHFNEFTLALNSSLAGERDRGGFFTCEDETNITHVAITNFVIRMITFGESNTVTAVSLDFGDNKVRVNAPYCE